MNQEKKNAINRRDFLGLSALGLTGLTILPSWRMPDGRRIPPSDRVVMGFIGLGRQGLGDYGNFTRSAGVQVVAGCDVDSLKRERFKRRVENWQKSQNMAQRCDPTNLMNNCSKEKTSTPFQSLPPITGMRFTPFMQASPEKMYMYKSRLPIRYRKGLKW